jgi:hypothetical protein
MKSTKPTSESRKSIWDSDFFKFNPKDLTWVLVFLMMIPGGFAGEVLEGYWGEFGSKFGFWAVVGASFCLVNRVHTYRAVLFCSGAYSLLWMGLHTLRSLLTQDWTFDFISLSGAVIGGFVGGAGIVLLRRGLPRPFSKI